MYSSSNGTSVELFRSVLTLVNSAPSYLMSP
jgi:hypothetical protein